MFAIIVSQVEHKAFYIDSDFIFFDGGEEDNVPRIIDFCSLILLVSCTMYERMITLTFINNS